MLKGSLWLVFSAICLIAYPFLSATAATTSPPAYVVNCITPGHASFVGTVATSRQYVSHHVHQCWTTYYQPLPTGMPR